MVNKSQPHHGGDIYGMARAMGTRPDEFLDLSANINPLGYPPGVGKAALDALELIRHYPDPQCMDLKEEIAAYHGLSPEEVLIGNGSTELIYLVARALRPRRALVVTPAFSEYERALRLAGISIAFHSTSEAENFTPRHGLDSLGCDMVFLANPTNPGGALLTPNQLLPIAELLDASGVYFVVDEAFVDFVEEASIKTKLEKFSRLIILRSFTKFFGIPGIRLGYVLASPMIIRRLEELREPWSVNVMAQAFGRACLSDLQFITRTRRVISREREYLHDSLSHIDGLRVFQGQANYLLVKLTQPGMTASELQRMLLPHRILIRDASNFRGLDERFFRTAVRLRKENDRLLEVLKVCLEGE